MTSATDIITYIGVPLAVLGVLPILYTFLLAIFTRRRIRAVLLHHGHKPLSTSRPHDGFTIRSSPMTSLIEVELPRYTIAPLERSDSDYWRTTDERREGEEEHHALLNRTESTLSMIEEGRVSGYLRGGSWRAFHWKKLIVGKKLYRIQYEDELREPPAEIDFSDLVHFLLDWGAIPDSMGWEKLRSNGLWTPAGTVLLRKADDENETKKKHVDWVLRTSMPDESDGVLSVTIKWSRGFESVSDVRGAASLPPGWGRLSQPALLEPRDKMVEDRRDLPSRISGLLLASKHALGSTSFRFRAENNVISQIRWEASHVETGFISLPFPSILPAAPTWFTSAAASLLTQKSSSTSLWNFDMPSEISNFCRRDSVPCGILVLLGLLSDIDAPQWSSQASSIYHNSFNTIGPNASLKHHQRFLTQREAEKLEVAMPPEQARISRMNRENERQRQAHQDMMDQLAERREREERRIIDAIASPRMSNKAAAEACLAWLIDQGEVGKEATVESVAEAVLYLFVLDQREDGEARKVVQLLNEWQDWCNAGGMKKQQYNQLEERKVEFCFAASLVAVIAGASATNQGQAGKDMIECLKNWRKVRLG